MRLKNRVKKTDLKLNIKKSKIVASSPITSWRIDGKMWQQWQILFSWAPEWLQIVTAAMKLKKKKKLLAPWKKSCDTPRQHSKKQGHHFANKGPSSQSHLWMWELDHKEGWVPKNWCFQIMVLEKTLESPLGSKEKKRVNSKGN